MGGLALGNWSDPDELTKLRSENEYITHKMTKKKANELYSAWKIAVKRALYR